MPSSLHQLSPDGSVIWCVIACARAGWLVESKIRNRRTKNAKRCERRSFINVSDCFSAARTDRHSGLRLKSTTVVRNIPDGAYEGDTRAANARARKPL